MGFLGTHGFSFDVFVGDVDGAGANIADDDDPNTTPPAADRIRSLGARADSGSGILVAALDGTTIEATPWGKFELDSETSLWVPLIAPVTITRSTSAGYLLIGAFGGLPIFVQLTGQVGGVKRVGIKMG